MSVKWPNSNSITWNSSLACWTKQWRCCYYWHLKRLCGLHWSAWAESTLKSRCDQPFSRADSLLWLVAVSGQDCSNCAHFDQFDSSWLPCYSYTTAPPTFANLCSNHISLSWQAQFGYYRPLLGLQILQQSPLLKCFRARPIEESPPDFDPDSPNLEFQSEPVSKRKNHCHCGKKAIARQLGRYFRSSSSLWVPKGHSRTSHDQSWDSPQLDLSTLPA